MLTISTGPTDRCARVCPTQGEAFLTFPPKTRPFPWKSDCAELGPQEGAMTRKRHTEEQIIAVLKDAQAGIV